MKIPDDKKIKAAAIKAIKDGFTDPEEFVETLSHKLNLDPSFIENAIIPKLILAQVVMFNFDEGFFLK